MKRQCDGSSGLWPVAVVLVALIASLPLTARAQTSQLQAATSRWYRLSAAARVDAVRLKAQSGGSYRDSLCERSPWLCTDTIKPYVGHDEPALLFYSDHPGSGNSATYTLVLPKDPPTLPKQDGTGGTFNFQLHPAFWFGMAMCDTQSAPEAVNTCTPDSDSNIFDNPDPTANDYVGFHPGGAFMEMQFYPPGWNGSINCGPNKWCAALNIDSLEEDQNGGTLNNPDCLNKVGPETVNFAFITKSGVSDTAADPLNPNNKQTPNLSTDLLMNSGDVLIVQMNDTAAGFKVMIKDLTTGEQGSMTASMANGFKQVIFDAGAASCTSQPYAFHPMYATSGEHTSLTWPTHSANVSFSDEIGHFEYCSSIDPMKGTCLASNEKVDADDTSCFKASSPFVPIGGCIGTDSDFDGVPYQLVWPGTNPNAAIDQTVHPSPVLFSSAQYESGGTLHGYERVALETNLPENETGGGCDPSSGNGCTVVPPGASFYPLFTTTTFKGQCMWQLGGLNIPATTNKFGEPGSSEWGSLILRTYPTIVGGDQLFDDFRNVLSTNPCPAAGSTPTATPKRTPTPTRTITRTPTRTASRTPNRTITRTPTRIPTRTPTHTPSRTRTRTPTRSPTRTPARTATRKPTPAPTR